MLTDTPSHSAWSESRMGQKSGDFRCRVEQEKHVGNVLSRRRHRATKLTGAESFARISLPPMLRSPHLPNPMG